MRGGWSRLIMTRGAESRRVFERLPRKGQPFGSAFSFPPLSHFPTFISFSNEERKISHFLWNQIKSGYSQGLRNSFKTKWTTNKTRPRKSPIKILAKSNKLIAPATIPAFFHKEKRTWTEIALSSPSLSISANRSQQWEWMLWTKVSPDVNIEEA